MKTVIVTLRRKSDGQRFVYYERVHDSVKPNDVWKRIRQLSKNVVLVKMTVVR